MAKKPHSGQVSDVDTAGTWDESWGEAQRLAGRYRVLHVAGRGGSGTVYVAVDEESGDRVACKWLHGTEDPRLPREIAALQRLDAPGVVRLRELCHHEGRPLLVMDHVAGSPWPGDLPAADDRTRWRDLRPRLVALVEVLCRVHAAGIVHRDLKPDNVLVDGEGSPTVLDFGLARGAALGTTITRQGVLVGTPRYLSPEVMSGHRPDGRADLYSVGVMAFEALAGCPPHQGDDFGTLHRARIGAPAPDLRLLRPGVPQAAADLVADLLRRDPDERPPSADAVLARLGADRGERIPWLGDRTVVAAVIAALSEGRPVRVSGPPGSGRSRVLREAAAGLEAQGCSCRWLAPGARPFESLGPLGVGSLQGSAVQVRGAAAAVLSAALAEGPVLVDEHRRLDRWTRSLLADVEGPLAQAVAPLQGGGGEELRLALLPATALRQLFHGPSRFLHLPEDAAALLHARTAGVPVRVAATIEAWVADGVLSWEDERLRVDRAALDREASRGEGPRLDRELEVEASLGETLQLVHVAGEQATLEVLAAAAGRPAWELELELSELADQGALLHDGEGVWRALARPAGARRDGAGRIRGWHAAVAAALPRGSVARVRHLLTAGVTTGVLEEAADAAVALWRGGRLDQARAVVGDALEAAGAAAPAAVVEPLVGVAVRLAIAEGRSGAILGARRLVGRFAPGRADLQALLDATACAAEGQHAQAAALLSELGFPGEPELEKGRQVVRMRTVRSGPAQDEAALLDELADWAAASADPEAGAMVQGWRGLQAYRAGDFPRAAALHRQAAAGKRTVTGRLSSLLNAASALLEAGELDAAGALTAEARGIAARHRQARFEARAWMLGRSVASRSRRPELRPAQAAVEELRHVDQGWLLGQSALIEASIAWHARDRIACIELARIAEDVLARAGVAAGADLASALRLALGDEAAVLRPTALARATRAPTTRTDSIQAELQALLFLAGVEPCGSTSADLLERFPRDTWDVPRGLFTPVEMAGVLAGELFPPVLEMTC